MTKTHNDYKLVYRMNYAMELIKMGHNVFSTSPNPQRPQLTMWVFEYDDTIDQDLEKIKEKHNGKKK